MTHPETVESAADALAAAWVAVRQPRPHEPAPVTAIRDQLARFLDSESGAVGGYMAGAALASEPRAVRYAGGKQATITLRPPQLSTYVSESAQPLDLDELPTDEPAHRAAILTSQAHTARVSAQSLRENHHQLRASGARRAERQIAAWDEHYAATTALLPDAFSSWWPDAHAAITAAIVPAFPTVVATPAPSYYAQLPQRAAQLQLPDVDI